eukprot:11803042-Alexandrium_andersonii.AAC.1
MELQAKKAEETARYRLGELDWLEQNSGRCPRCRVLRCACTRPAPKGYRYNSKKGFIRKIGKSDSD